jgi:O-antigen/teichoic acid export membrane protein
VSEQQPVEGTSMRRQLSQAVAWNVAFTPLKLVIDTASTIIRFNILSKAEIGAISLLSSTASSVGIWIDLGIDGTLPKFIPEVDSAGGQGAVRRFLRTVIALKMVILALALLALPVWGGLLLRAMRRDVQELATAEGGQRIAPLAEQLARYGAVFVGAVAALVLLGSLYDTLRAYLVSFFRQKAWNVITYGMALMMPLLSAAAVLLGWGVLGVVLAMVLTAVTSVVVTWGHVRRAMRLRQGGAELAPIPEGTWRTFRGYATFAFLISASDYFSSNYFAVYWLSGLQEIALFSVAYNLIKQLQGYVYTPMTGIQVPLFARVRAEGDERLPRVFATLARLLLLLTVPSAVLSMLFIHNLVLVQYPQFQASVSIALVLLPFLFTEPFWGLGHNLLMVHEAYAPVMLSRLASLSSIPLLALLIPRLGITGAAIAIGAGKALAGLVVLGAAMRRYRLAFPWRFAGKVLLASLIAAAAVAPLLLWRGRMPLTEDVGTRLLYALLTVALGALALAVLVGAMRLLRVLHADDRALRREIRNPIARRIERWL